MTPRARLSFTRRRIIVVLLLAVGLVLLAYPLVGADVFGNVGPASQLPGGGIAGRYPIGNYALDSHFDAVKAGVFSGVDVSGVPPTIAYFLANVLWQLTAFLANALITLFVFAFSLDLVNGSSATGGQGALAPVSQAVSSIYAHTFGTPWMTVAITAAGIWAMWKALVQRRYVETAGALALSLVCCLVALLLVTQPQRTIGAASRLTNQVSAGLLSLTSKGQIGDQAAAKQAAADQLFALLVQDPWTVLEFGGIEHCVKAPAADDPVSVAVQPLSTDPAQSAALARQLRSGTEVQAPGKTCVNDENKYAGRFLQFAPESDDRNAEYAALKAGDTGKLPDSDPAKQHPEQAHYPLGNVDKPAAQASDKGGQYQRLLLAVIVFSGELGAFLLLGSLSIGVVLAQVLALLLLGFAPVALVIGIYPGRGHTFFFGWLGRLVSFLVRKALYSLILAVLLAVAAAVADASVNLGWLMSWGLQAVFFWSVYLFRNDITRALTVAVGGAPEGAPNPAGLRRFALTYLGSLYAAARVARPVASAAREVLGSGARTARHALRHGGVIGAGGVAAPLLPTLSAQPAPSAASRPRPPRSNGATDGRHDDARPQDGDDARGSRVDHVAPNAAATPPPGREPRPGPEPPPSPERAEVEGPWPPVRRRSRRGRRPLQTATTRRQDAELDATAPPAPASLTSSIDAPPAPQPAAGRSRPAAPPSNGLETASPFAATPARDPDRHPSEAQPDSLRDALREDEQRFRAPAPATTPGPGAPTSSPHATPPVAPRPARSEERRVPGDEPHGDRRSL